MLDERVLAVLARLEAEDAAEREAGLPASAAVAAGRADHRAVPVRAGGEPGGDRGARDRRLARLLVDLARRRRAGARRSTRLARARPGEVRGVASERRRRGARGVGGARRRRRRGRCEATEDIFDLVFLDAEKDDYETLFGSRGRCSSRAVSWSPTTCSRTSETLGAYSAARQADPALSSVTVPLDRGLELSVVLARLPDLRHQAVQVAVGIAEERHPELVVGHARDQMRLVLELDTTLRELARAAPMSSTRKYSVELG